MIFRYLVYELVVETPFPCPLLPLAPVGVRTDITVVEGGVPRSLEMVVASEKNWDVSHGRFLLRGGPKAGRFLVEGGERITLQKNAGAENDRLAVNFFVSALTVLLQQRGLLVLHANTALAERGAVAVCGESGAGKTTTIAGILAKGGRLLADDITVCRIGDNGIMEVLPGPPLLHLCEDTADQFGFDISGVPQYPWRRMKAALPVPEIMAEAPASLNSIYFVKAGSSQMVTCRQLKGAEKFNTLQECIYGPLLPETHEKMFHHVAVVMDQVPVYLLERPRDSWSLDEVVKVIMNG